MSARAPSPVRLACLIGLAAGLVGIALGCNLSTSRADRPVPLPPGVEPNDLIDRDYKAESENPLAAEELQEAEKQIRQYFAKEMKGKEPAEKDRKNILVLSGGGSLGAYPAGLLVGWTGVRHPADVRRGHRDQHRRADRPARLPRVGVRPDPAASTTPRVTNDDIFTRRRVIQSLFADSFADNAPLAAGSTAWSRHDRMRPAGRGARQGPPALRRHDQPRHQAAGGLGPRGDRHPRHRGGPRVDRRSPAGVGRRSRGSSRRAGSRRPSTGCRTRSCTWTAG